MERGGAEGGGGRAGGEDEEEILQGIRLEEVPWGFMVGGSTF